MNFFIVGGSDPLDMAHHAVLIRFPAKLCSNFSLFDCDSLSFVAILLSFVRPDQCDVWEGKNHRATVKILYET